MPLPPDVDEAKTRMELADVALRADIESDQPPDGTRRIQLIDELQIASDGSAWSPTSQSYLLWRLYDNSAPQVKPIRNLVSSRTSRLLFLPLAFLIIRFLLFVCLGHFG